MAYNYFPVTYQNPYYAQPQIQPQYQQNQVQSNGILWVSSELEAQNYPVAPNNAVALWDSSKPAIYLKQADASGKPVMKVYMLSERTDAPQMKQESSEYKLSDFALKSEIEPIMSAIAALKEDVKLLKRKKKEVAEDDE
jgi:hypothetical protein